MKNSEKYYAAMICVVNSHSLCAADKLEIIERLLSDKGIAELVEKQEAEKAAAEEEW